MGGHSRSVVNTDHDTLLPLLGGAVLVGICFKYHLSTTALVPVVARPILIL